MHYGDYIDAVRELIDNAVGSLFQLPNVITVVLRDFAARTSNGSQLQRTLDQTSNEIIGDSGRFLRDLGMDLQQPRFGAVGSDNLHSSSPNSRNTSSAGVTRPAALSAMPASISLQTTAR